MYSELQAAGLIIMWLPGLYPSRVNEWEISITQDL